MVLATLIGKEKLGKKKCMTHKEILMIEENQEWQNGDGASTGNNNATLS